MDAARTPCAGAGAPAFHRRGGELWCEDVPVSRLAGRFGTPLYVYSGAVIDERLAAVRAAFGPAALVCYAVKANGNLAILARMHAGGAGFDLVSGGELARLAA
ncbi:MAG: diaminopimelate decarboxylase, partial [Planctomycetota bacterium]